MKLEIAYYQGELNLFPVSPEFNLYIISKNVGKLAGDDKRLWRQLEQQYSRNWFL